ncbi:hypothetical protein NEIRO03_2135 [Nematocida sp. AWRm78]|nr:hypothetical protein NEIRO02_2100 [Nematocida sp. AWRm79]KAI5185849.1 hypothetical protein NEIRO03_2135 [Nematocida sp. AWRm78]
MNNQKIERMHNINESHKTELSKKNSDRSLLSTSENESLQLDDFMDYTRDTENSMTTEEVEIDEFNANADSFSYSEYLIEVFKRRILKLENCYNYAIIPAIIVLTAFYSIVMATSVIKIVARDIAIPANILPYPKDLVWKLVFRGLYLVFNIFFHAIILIKYMTIAEFKGRSQILNIKKQLVYFGIFLVILTIGGMLGLIENLMFIKSISILFIIMHIAHMIFKIVDILFLMNKKNFRVIFFKYSRSSHKRVGFIIYTINILVYILIVSALITSIHGWLPAHLDLDSKTFAKYIPHN